MNDNLGNRMKQYEAAEAGRKLMPLLPVIARIDGRSFHSFTKGMKRPYDIDFNQAMINTTLQLVEHTNACIGYTQSDEITLVWHSTDHKSQIFFDGRIMKMTSQLAALATLYFYREVESRMPAKYADKLPTFDARVWNLPNRQEAINCLIWREWDATKNSLTMAASCLYSHNELHNKHSAQKHDMLMAKGVNWNDYPNHFKRGTYVQRKKKLIPFSVEELQKLPPLHMAHKNPNMMVERNVLEILELPPLTKINNREDVIFNGADYKITEEDKGH